MNLATSRCRFGGRQRTSWSHRRSDNGLQSDLAGAFLLWLHLRRRVSAPFWAGQVSQLSASVDEEPFDIASYYEEHHAGFSAEEGDDKMRGVTEEMIADLLTKIVSGAQDLRLTVRFYSLCPHVHNIVITNDGMK